MIPEQIKIRWVLLGTKTLTDYKEDVRLNVAQLLSHLPRVCMWIIEII